MSQVTVTLTVASDPANERRGVTSAAVRTALLTAADMISQGSDTGRKKLDVPGLPGDSTRISTYNIRWQAMGKLDG